MDNFLSENDDQGLNHDINTEIEELKEVIFQHFQVVAVNENFFIKVYYFNINLD